MPRYFVRKLTTVAIFALLLKPIVHDHLRGNFWSLEKTLKFNPIYHLSAKMITRILCYLLLKFVIFASLARTEKQALYLKITEKVSFNIASEASYLYILSGQKLIKNAKNGPFWRVFENLKLAVKQCYQTGQF